MVPDGVAGPEPIGATWSVPVQLYVFPVCMQAASTVVDPRIQLDKTAVEIRYLEATPFIEFHRHINSMA